MFRFEARLLSLHRRNGVNAESQNKRPECRHRNDSSYLFSDPKYLEQPQLTRQSQYKQRQVRPIGRALCWRRAISAWGTDKRTWATARRKIGNSCHFGDGQRLKCYYRSPIWRARFFSEAVRFRRTACFGSDVHLITAQIRKTALIPSLVFGFLRFQIGIPCNRQRLFDVRRL